ncbi:hypothetical protein TcWFU_000173 [Taenia crassiceps]|uniref:Uncharacterized protein n=1 Tax=Taenia crassiceps TaxID=6207 RepID=A0ABR4Q6N5_9CEST
MGRAAQEEEITPNSEWTSDLAVTMMAIQRTKPNAEELSLHNRVGVLSVEVQKWALMGCEEWSNHTQRQHQEEMSRWCILEDLRRPANSYHARGSNCLIAPFHAMGLSPTSQGGDCGAEPKGKTQLLASLHWSCLNDLLLSIPLLPHLAFAVVAVVAVVADVAVGGVVGCQGREQPLGEMQQ